MHKTSHKTSPQNPPEGDWKVKADEYLAGWKRTQADFENYRKRVESDKSEWIKLATAEAFLKIVPILEDFRRAFIHIPAEVAESSWVAGIKQVEQHLRQTLISAGLEPIETGTEFDPNLHEAIAYEEHPELPDGTIIDFIDMGWKINGRVLRPARVRVSKGK